MKLPLKILVVNGFYCTATKQCDANFGRDSNCCGLRTLDIQKVACSGCFWTCGRDASWIYFLRRTAWVRWRLPVNLIAPFGIDVNDKAFGLLPLGRRYEQL